MLSRDVMAAQNIKNAANATEEPLKATKYTVRTVRHT